MGITKAQCIVAGPQIPDPGSSSIAAVTSDELNAGWRGATVTAHMPNAASYYSVRANDCLNEAIPFLRVGVAVQVRLSWSVDPGSPYWQGLAGGPIDCANYPPAGKSNALWLAIAKYHDTVRAAFSTFCTNNHISPSLVSFEGGNESDLGGAGGPYVGPYSKVKPYLTAAYQKYTDYQNGTCQYGDFLAVWTQACPSWVLNPDGSPPPLGTIPPRFFAMRRVVRGAVSYFASGFNFIGYTFESEGKGNGYPIQFERDSWTGDDAAAYAKMCNRMRRNCYNSGAYRWVAAEKTRRFLSPSELAQDTQARIMGGTYNGVTYGGIPYLQANPILAAFPLSKWGVTETNVMLSAQSNSPTGWGIPGSTASQRDVNVALYRQAEVNMLGTLPIGWAGLFTATASDPQTEDDPFWTYASGILSPIGAEVTPGS